jgi:two-component system, LuxR family, response regulator FixJ
MTQAVQLPDVPTLILVEDDLALLALRWSVLTREGFSVIARASADALMKDVPQADYLIVTHHPPGLDGLGLLGRLRDLEIVTPAILITKPPSLGLKDRARTLGAQLVEEPLTPNVLVDLMHALLGREPETPEWTD